MTKARINKAIAHLGVEIVGNGDGYFYFIDLERKFGQIGRSVMVCYLNHQSLERWVSDAECAVKEHQLESLDA